MARLLMVLELLVASFASDFVPVIGFKSCDELLTVHAHIIHTMCIATSD